MGSEGGRENSERIEQGRVDHRGTVIYANPAAHPMPFQPDPCAKQAERGRWLGLWHASVLEHAPVPELKQLLATTIPHIEPFVARVGVAAALYDETGRQGPCSIMR